MEKWDVYDKDRNIIENKVAIRGKDDLKNGEYHLVTVGWIYNSKGELLLQKRAAHEKYPLVFANHGGCALQGETSTQSMIREFEEEIGVRFKEDELYLLRSFKDNETIFDEYIVFKDIDVSKLEIDNTEVESCDWFSLIEIDKLIESNECFDYKQNVEDGTGSYRIVEEFIEKIISNT